LKRVHRTLSNTIADPLTAPEAARMAESIRAVFNTNAQVLRFMPDEGEPFSIRQWMTADKAPGSILFVTSDYDDLEMNKPLLTLWMNIAINSLMTLPRTRSLRTWFLFDEVGALHRLPAIEKGLQTARNFGGAMILGLHSFQKLVEVYGEEGARNLSSLARTKLILATGDIKTAEECSHYIGSREVRQMDEAYSYGYNQTRDASTLTARKQVEPLVLPDDITNLPALHGFVKFPEGFPAARILLQWKAYPKVAEGFLRRAHVEPVRSTANDDYFAEEEDEAGGRDGAAQVAEGARDPAYNLAKELAARILIDGVEDEHHDTGGRVGDGNAARAGEAALGDHAADEKGEGTDASRAGVEQPVAPARASGADRADHHAPRASPVEDQSLVELRQDFSGGIDDNLDMGI
ncbi:MAG TPA: type IV secretion system DNA-binding domain-containing protein, partial [Sphingobium sp.]|nr:type IV secretion system DNA-binding domain-containing protein [Sphingobium sp.]